METNQTHQPHFLFCGYAGREKEIIKFKESREGFFGKHSLSPQIIDFNILSKIRTFKTLM